MPLGDGRIRSFLLEPTFANVAGMTPEDVARRRALAEALLGESQANEPVTSVFGGMNRVLQAFLGGRGMRQAESADAFLRNREQERSTASTNSLIDLLFPQAAPRVPPPAVGQPGFDGRPSRENVAAFENAAAPMAFAPSGTGVDAGVRMLDQFEGFRPTPYEDWSYRPGTGERYLSGMRIGYGQDASGLPGQIDQTQAQELLRQQIEGQYIPSIVGTIGPERWRALNPDQQGVLISLVHNYGSLPNRILDEIATGDPQAISGAIAALGGDNQGINQGRREAEAAYFAGGGGQQGGAAGQDQRTILRQLASDPSTLPIAQAIIQQQVAAMFAPPEPPETNVLGRGDQLYRGNQLVAENEPAPEFQESVFTDAERVAAGLPELPEGQVWVKTENGFTTRGASSPLVAIDQRQQTALDQRLGQTLGDLFGGMITEGAQAQTDIALIDRLGTLLTETGGGVMPVLAQVAGNFGINVDGVTDPVQAATSIINYLTPRQRVPGSGATSDFDARMFAASLPRLMNQPGANQIIIDTMRGLAQQKIAMADIAMRVALPEGDPFRLSTAQAFDALRALPDPFAAFKASGFAEQEGALPAAGAETPRTGGQPVPGAAGNWEYDPNTRMFYPIP